MLLIICFDFKRVMNMLFFCFGFLFFKIVVVFSCVLSILVFVDDLIEVIEV